MLNLLALSLSESEVGVVAVVELAVEALLVLVQPPSLAQLQRLCSSVLSSQPDGMMSDIVLTIVNLHLAAIPVNPLYGDAAPQVLLEPAVERDALADVVDH